jgi:HK97 gp10 family phage protein
MSIEIKLEEKGIEELKTKMERLDHNIWRNVHQQLRKLGADMKNMAQQIVPVKTGRLRASIYAKVQEWRLRVGATAPYAVFVEFGTRYMRGRRFLSQTIETYRPRLVEIIKRGIDNAIHEAGGS